jgi:hypothetical protein
MVGVQLGQTLHSKELHRSFNVSSEDVSRSLHAVLPTCHESIQVCPTNKRCTGPKGDRCNDVAAVHDPAVHIYLSIGADRIDHGLYEKQRGGGAIELSTAVVRQDDRICTQICDTPGIFDRLDALHHDRPIPMLTQPHKIIEVECWVEETIR